MGLQQASGEGRGPVRLFVATRQEISVAAEAVPASPLLVSAEKPEKSGEWKIFVKRDFSA
jgi:hypothetical protein